MTLKAKFQREKLGERLHEMMLETTHVGMDTGEFRENVALHLLRNGATAVVTAHGLDIFNTIGTRVQQVQARR